MAEQCILQVFTYFPIAAQCQLACCRKSMYTLYQTLARQTNYLGAHLDQHLLTVCEERRKIVISTVPAVYLKSLFLINMAFLTRMTFNRFCLYFPFQSQVNVKIAFVKTPASFVEYQTFTLDLFTILIEERLLFSPCLFILFHGIRFQLTEKIANLLGDVFSFTWAIDVTIGRIDVQTTTTSICHTRNFGLDTNTHLLTEMMTSTFSEPYVIHRATRWLCLYLYTTTLM